MKLIIDLEGRDEGQGRGVMESQGVRNDVT
jgi:hypothetical protein